MARDLLDQFGTYDPDSGILELGSIEAGEAFGDILEAGEANMGLEFLENLYSEEGYVPRYWQYPERESPPVRSGFPGRGS
jgi:hypothetical protein